MRLDNSSSISRMVRLILAILITIFVRWVVGVKRASVNSVSGLPSRSRSDTRFMFSGSASSSMRRSSNVIILASSSRDSPRVACSRISSRASSCMLAISAAVVGGRASLAVGTSGEIDIILTNLVSMTCNSAPAPMPFQLSTQANPSLRKRSLIRKSRPLLNLTDLGTVS